MIAVSRLAKSFGGRALFEDVARANIAREIASLA